MHTNRSYKFNDETEAKKFAEDQRSTISPDQDKYVRGPFFMDDDVTFKNMPWANKGRKYWEVDVEIYC